MRGERGWSLAALAGASGVSRSMLSQIEREQANPTLAVTLRIAQAFGMALGDLLGAGAALSMFGLSVVVDRALFSSALYRRRGRFTSLRDSFPSLLFAISGPFRFYSWGVRFWQGATS